MTVLIPEIYVLWHPRCAQGNALAHHVYDWLRPGHGMGPQVFFRSLPDPVSPESIIPLPLPGENRAGRSTPTRPSSTVQILVLLIDAHMVADAAWRHWIKVLRSPGASTNSRIFLPVAMDLTAYNLNEGLRELNFLRPVKFPAGSGAQNANVDARDPLTRSFLRQLTEALSRLTWGGTMDVSQADLSTWFRQADAPKLKIFLSHAKRDGATPARRIRDYIYSQTQIAAFFDENDIPMGTGFAAVLDENVESPGTAAMIAVRTEAYSRRPWCRRELSVFRRPKMRRPAQSGVEHWSLQPVLVVDALEEKSRAESLPEFGNSPVIRWANDEDLSEEIVTTLLRDALLSAYHDALGRTLQVSGPALIVNWRPDPISLLQLPPIRFDEHGTPTAREWRVFHPGREFSGQDLDIFYDYFPNLEFHSFDSVTP